MRQLERVERAERAYYIPLRNLILLMRAFRFPI